MSCKRTLKIKLDSIRIFSNQITELLMRSKNLLLDFYSFKILNFCDRIKKEIFFKFKFKKCKIYFLYTQQKYLSLFYFFIFIFRDITNTFNVIK